MLGSAIYVTHMIDEGDTGYWLNVHTDVSGHRRDENWSYRFPSNIA